MSKLSKNDQANIGIGTLILGLVLIVVGMALYPTVQTSTNASVAAAGGTSTASGSILALVPLFFVLVILAGILVYVAFRD
jgi:cytochrome bd-type quinol oxidase subunit 2